VSHVLAVIAIGSRLGEIGKDLGVAGLDEGAVPQGTRLRLGAERPLGLLRLLAPVAVDGEEGGEQLGLRNGAPALGQELGQLALEEVVLDLDGIGLEAARLHLDGHGPRGGVSRLVLGYRGEGRPLIVPGEGDEVDEEIGLRGSAG
jgi:hypothetical protein